MAEKVGRHCWQRSCAIKGLRGRDGIGSMRMDLANSGAFHSMQAWGQRQPVSMQYLVIAMMAGAAGIASLKAYKDEKIQQARQSTRAT